jgi:hypothetical protein
MKTNQITLQDLFDNLKDGDFLAFYAKKWWQYFAKLIFWVTGVKVSHIAAVFDVKRKDNILTFSVGGRVTNTYMIVHTMGDYLIDSRFKDDSNDFYYLPNKFKINRSQNKKLREFWNTKDDYNFSELLLTPNFVCKGYNWLREKLGKEPKDFYDGVCSSAAAQSMRAVGITDSKFNDKVPNPREFISFSYIESINKVNI